MTCFAFLDLGAVRCGRVVLVSAWKAASSEGSIIRPPSTVKDASQNVEHMSIGCATLPRQHKDT